MFWHWIPKKLKIQPGVFIPQVTKAPTRAIMVRPAMSLVVVSSVCLLVFAATVSATQSRLTQVAAPILVYSQSEPYQQSVMRFGPDPALRDVSTVQQISNALAAASSDYIVVDVIANQIEVFQSGQNILTAPIAAVTRHGDWRFVPAGLYQIGDVKSSRYSTLEQQYYPHSVLFGTNFSIHGTPYQIGTTTVIKPTPQGVQLSNADAAALSVLIEVGDIVVVRNDAQTAPAAVVTYQSVGPAVPARAYLVADIETGDVLIESAPDTTFPVASLTKLMTALLVVETYDLENDVVVEQEQYVTTLVSRLPGNRTTSVFDLLQLLLLESSNEAAEVLATQIGRDLFIVQMNELADRLGLAGTTFTDPSGLDDGNVSSAQDLFTLTQYIYNRYPFLLTITAEERFVDVARVNDFTDLSNFNIVEGLDTFVGGKIGETLAAKQTSVTLHNMTLGALERPVVIILLGSEARDADVTRLHDWVTEQFFAE